MHPRTVYLGYVRVRHHHLDSLGHVNNAVYLNYLEGAAIDHAEAVGWGQARQAEFGGVFVARRHEIDYLRPARAGDVLCVRTWPEAIDAARAIRADEITRLTAEELAAGPTRDALLPPEAVPTPLGDVLVRARTVWAFVDLATGRPKRIPPEVRRNFLVD